MKYKRILAIGDTHGALLSLKALLNKVKPTQDDVLYFTGDYVDRGPLIPQLIDYLIDLKKEFPKTRFLKGNHDEMFIKYLKHELRLDEHQTFIHNGGSATLNQYDKYLDRTPGHYFLVWDDIPKSHQDFFNSLEPIIIDEDNKIIFVHAGLRPEIDIDKQYNKDLMWIREPFLSTNYKWGDYKIVHGHTPMTTTSAKKYHEKHPERYNVDTGCVFGYTLTCVDVLNDEWWEQECLDNI